MRILSKRQQSELVSVLLDMHNEICEALESKKKKKSVKEVEDYISSAVIYGMSVVLGKNKAYELIQSMKDDDDDENESK